MNRKIRGLKPIDIGILGFLITEGSWPSQVDISRVLNISQSEVSLGLRALEKVELINLVSKKVNLISAKNFIVHTVKYLLPIEKEGLGRGFLAGPSSHFFNKKVHARDIYIWPHEDGDSRGVIVNSAVEKLSSNTIANEKLYLFLCIVDIFRGLGGIRHLKEAELKLLRLLDE